MKNKLLVLTIFALFFNPGLLPAQVPLQMQGIGGQIDNDHIGPILSVSASYANGNTKILADAVVNDDKYKSYPIQFDIYINRNLFITQIRSTELPGPIGVDIPSTTVAPPLNYAVVAKMMTPSRTYNTAIFGAVTASAEDPARASDSNSASVLENSPSDPSAIDCTLTSNANDDALVSPYVANAVSSERVDEMTFSISFEGSSLESGSGASVVGNIAIKESTASGTISISLDGQDETVPMSGTASSSGDSLVTVDLSSVDGNFTLKCS